MILSSHTPFVPVQDTAVQPEATNQIEAAQ